MLIEGRGIIKHLDTLIEGIDKSLKEVTSAKVGCELRGKRQALQNLKEEIKKGIFDLKSLTLEKIRDLKLPEKKELELIAIRAGLFEIDKNDDAGHECRNIIRKWQRDSLE